MGVSIRSSKHSFDMGYIGFNRFRTIVAELENEEFGEHYKTLIKATMFESDEFYKQFDLKTKKFIDEKKVSIGIINFCLQSDCNGSIDKSQAKEIYELIKDCDDDLIYGYQGRTDCTKMKQLKELFNDCNGNSKKIEWY